jgi:hypothetical protein
MLSYRSGVVKVFGFLGLAWGIPVVLGGLLRAGLPVRLWCLSAGLLPTLASFLSFIQMLIPKDFHIKSPSLVVPRQQKSPS